MGVVMGTGCWRRAAALLAVGALGLTACSSAASKQITAGTQATVPPTTVPPTTSTTVAPPPPAPLTGLPATNAANAARPALSVKIDNAPGAQPQSGLNAADIVTEEPVEGGLTRLMATFQTNDADNVGPIRSARPVDADLLRLFGGGILAYSGAADGEIAPVKNHGGATLLSFDDGVSAFHRERGRQSPHDVVASTPDLYDAAKADGNKMGPPPAVFSYDATPPAGSPAATIEVPFSNFMVANWTWHPDSHSYERDQNGSPDQLSDGSVANATDVVVLSVGMQRTGIYDAAGNEDPFVVTTGSGQAWLFRDGVMVKGTWTRPSYDKPMVLRTEQGQPMTLHPGRSWIELLPQGRTPTPA